ncbi:MAG: autotransporter-associated beta strand repeat-containing protein [Phycisphaeraceae bacterium]
MHLSSPSWKKRKVRRSFLRLSQLLASAAAMGLATQSPGITITANTQLTPPVTVAPGSIGGLVVHLDANDVSNTGTNPADGTQINTWVNKAAGGAGDFTAAIAASNPYVNWTGNPMNGNAVVHFWGGLLRNTTNFGNNVTVMYVGRMDGGGNARLVAGNANNWLLGYWSNGKDRSYWNGTPQNLTGTPIDYLSHLYVGSADGINATSYRGDPSESVIGSGALGGTGQGPNGLSLGGWGAGGGGAGSEGSYADFGELLVFNHALSAVERGQMEDYLRAKWYGALPSTEAVTITATGTLDLNGVNQTIGSLAGVNGAQVLLNGAWLTTGQDNTSTTYSGTIADGSVSGGSLSKIGAGILTLDGPSANTYTGQTVINQGSLVLSKTAGVTALPGDILMLNSLSPNIWMTTNNQLGGNGVLTFATEVNNVIGHGRFMLEGTTQTLAGIQSNNGIQAGVIQNSESGVAGPANAGTSLLVLAGSGNYSFNGFLRNGSSGVLGLSKTGAGVQTLSGNQINYTGATNIADGQLILFNAAGYNSPTSIANGAVLSWSGNTNSQNNNGGATIALNDGATLENLNPNHWTVINGAVTASGNTVINHAANATGGSGRGFYLDGGLKGDGTVTINALNAGSGVNFRNNNSTFSGKIIVNGIASATPFAGSGIGVGGNTAGLTNADIELNGTMELLGQGIGWANSAPGDFFMGALSGTGIMVGNHTAGGQTRVRLGNNNHSGEFTGTIVNGNGNVIVLTKNGTGVQTLSGANLYSGLTTVAAGTLLVHNTTGSGLGSGNVVVKSGATLGGDGSFTGALLLEDGSMISPGMSPGVLSTGAVTVGTSAAGTVTYFFDPGDLIMISGDLTLVSNIIVNVNSPLAAQNAIYPLFMWTGNLTGFDPLKFTVNASTGSTRIELDLANNKILLVTIVPEPATLSLLAVGSVALLRRKQRQAL